MMPLYQTKINTGYASRWGQVTLAARSVLSVRDAANRIDTNVHY